MMQRIFWPIMLVSDTVAILWYVVTGKLHARWATRSYLAVAVCAGISFVVTRAYVTQAEMSVVVPAVAVWAIGMYLYPVNNRRVYGFLQFLINIPLGLGMGFLFAVVSLGLFG